MRKFLFLLLALAFLSPALPLGAAEGLSVYGVAPGMTRTQVEGVLGRPARDSEGPQGSRILGYLKGGKGKEDPQVWVDKAGKVTFVAGTRLDRGGKTLLKAGATPEELQGAVGGDATVEQGPRDVTVCIYKAQALRAVLGGKPPRVRVFGLGQEPASK